MDSTSPVKQPISCELKYNAAFSLVLMRNSIQVVYELRLKNEQNRDFHEVECSFTSTPALIKPKSVMLELLKADEEYVTHNIDLQLDYDRLAGITEELPGQLQLDIVSQGELLFTCDYKVTALAPDQLIGLSKLPELIASFVTPSLEVITHLQSIVAEELLSSTGSASIQSYQAGKTRAYQICAAIYRAISSWRINYASSSSSFGLQGQRVRFADTIYKYRLANCLDLSLLFASLMEHCDLHPVILLLQDHAFIGCHLVERYFPDVITEDLQKIRKLVSLDEFLVLEAVAVTKDLSFSAAEALAQKDYLGIVDGSFSCAIDVVRARYSGVQPLPLKRSTEGIVFETREREAQELQDEQIRGLHNDIDLKQLKTKASQPARVARWTQKLLDLSLRNRLLNVRDTKQVIPLACPDITLLEDMLAANDILSIHPLAELLSNKDVNDLSKASFSDVTQELKPLLSKELNQGRLWTQLPSTELVRRLTGLYRLCRTDMEEGGVSTLFLAIGFLEWRISEKDSRSYLAPLLLLPVRLERRSLAEGIRITRLDEDTIINETLLEMLRSQFKLTVPGLSPLPMDASGVDVASVLRIFQQTIKDMKGWEVREEARIGHFSFSKFIMWHDMTTRLEALEQNPLVKHLISGSGIFTDDIEVFPPEEIGKHLSLGQLYCPMSADSSQLTAVMYSQAGKSFVLHGPPGTGKSQTITNIIAHNLAKGSRVLFVSEKKAALDVVHRRLSAIGLRPFCLELHSTRAGKTEVLAQFAEALSVPEVAASGEWENVAQTLEQLRGELNDYVEALHHHYPNGLCAYDCFSRSFQPALELPTKLLELDLLEQSQVAMEETKRLAADLVTAWSGTTPQAIAGWRLLSVVEWSPIFEKNLMAALKECLEAVTSLRRVLEEQTSFWDLPLVSAPKQVAQTVSWLEQLTGCCYIPAPLLSCDLAQYTLLLQRFALLTRQRYELSNKLQSFRLELICELNCDSLATRLKECRSAFFLVRPFKSRSLLKEMSILLKPGSEPLTLELLEQRLSDFVAYAACQRELTSISERVQSLLGQLWNEGSPDWELVNRTLEQARLQLQQVQQLAGDDPELSNRLITKLQTVLPQAAQRLAPASPEREGIRRLALAWQVCQQAIEHMLPFVPAWSELPDLEQLSPAINTMLTHSSDLRGALRYRLILEQAQALGLKQWAKALEAGSIPLEQTAQAFEQSYMAEMLEQILEHSPVLCHFSGVGQDERVARFVELDRRYTHLAQDAVYAKLAAALPRRRSGACPEGTELGILKRECEKRARQKSVRQLLELIPNLAPVLKPCFLMSPMSVAQYLPPDTAQFDLIVFDEASQIPVWDAIGVIARGKQLVVVGDPKQLPPTNFFQKNEAEEDSRFVNEMDDMESILDECLAAGVHSSYLNWHYRSRHESLIAFSNHYYYQDHLYTFPAARNTEKLGVCFRFIPDGVYDRRGTRTNPLEAEALVRYVFECLETPGQKQRSIGVVTFSQAQKDLIEDLLEQERMKHPNLEEYFSEHNDEPLFVKNLENVQGDERDVILFSICYAADEEGKLSMNFGPLNRQGGERRLNVAITRAKEQVVVFSSIHSWQIDQGRTSAIGAAHLKYFLDYAEKGLRIDVNRQGMATAAGLSQTIAELLKDHDYEVERNVGSSGYRIDLAVRNPEQPDEYLLAIECDGAAYAAQRTTRDRDCLRSSVLASLGWHTYRAWSVDWALDRSRAQDHLLSLLERLRSEYLERRQALEEAQAQAQAQAEAKAEAEAKAKAEAEAEAEAEAKDQDQASEPSISRIPGLIETQKITIPLSTSDRTCSAQQPSLKPESDSPQSLESNTTVSFDTPCEAVEQLKEEAKPIELPAVSPAELPTQDPIPSPAEPSAPAQAEHCSVYQIWSPEVLLQQSEFYAGDSRKLIRAQMLEVLELEGPIYESVLKKRIQRAWGFARAGDTIQEVLNACLPRNATTTCLGRERVYWGSHRSPEDFQDYRVAEEAGSRRSWEEIPPEEIANAMREVLLDLGACECGVLYRETVKLFGFSALTNKARVYLDIGRMALEQQPFIKIENNIYYWTWSGLL